MPSPHAVVIPFGVPVEGRGLGLGLAAMVHAFSHVDGGGVAIAQMHGRRHDQPADATPFVVEAFVPPAAWRDIGGEARSAVGVVLTGTLEPPANGDGKIHLLAFDAQDGATRATVDATIEEGQAGASLVGALERLWSALGGELGAVQGLRDLGWESLESVLRAERCALHDPVRGGPHDRLAAMLHLGRAIADAPEARYPVERLAALALEAANGPAHDMKLTNAAARALARAVEDAPVHVELVEALAAIELRSGAAAAAARRLQAAMSAGSDRPRLRALLSQALRAQGDLPGALAAVDPASAPGGVAEDPLLLAERGVVLAAMGDLVGAATAWKRALGHDPVHPEAYASLAGLALHLGDGAAAQSLVDAALASPGAHPEVLRRAIQLTLTTEHEGLARASRVAKLCGRLLELQPGDPWTCLALARSLVHLGDVAVARARLADVDRVAPQSPAAAEAQLLRFSIDEPQADIELRSALRAAHHALPADLPEVAARARHLATAHGPWSGWLAAAVAERRLRRWAPARDALTVALRIAPGATAAHLEMATALRHLGDAHGALAHARRAFALEGEGPRTLATLAEALAATGEATEALHFARRGLGLQPQDEALKALVSSFEAGPPAKPALADRLRRLWRPRRP